MFIFLDSPDFSPKLFAEGESEIHGLQIQRDGSGWSGVKHRVWILLWHMNWRSYWDKNPHFTLMAHFGYPWIHQNIHFPALNFPGVPDHYTGDLLSPLPNSPPNFDHLLIFWEYQYSPEVYANHPIRNLMTEMIQELQFGSEIDFTLSFSNPGGSSLFYSTKIHSGVYGVCRLVWHTKLINENTSHKFSVHIQSLHLT